MVERILELIKQSGLCDYAFEKQLGFAVGTIGNWRNGRNKLSSEAVIKLAQFFNISADYLLCLTDEPTPLKQSNSEKQSSAISIEFVGLSQDKDFIDTAKLYKAMPKDCKEKVNAFTLGVATGSGLNVEKILGK